MKLLSDADGCPVVKSAIRIAHEFNLKVCLVSDTSHEFFDTRADEIITVSKGADSADFAIANRILPGDLVVTQDYGLAALCLARRAVPIHQDGIRSVSYTHLVNGYEFPGCEGMETKVDVYSPHDEVELFVNGKSCGKQPAGDAAQYKATFIITY